MVAGANGESVETAGDSKPCLDVMVPGRGHGDWQRADSLVLPPFSTSHPKVWFIQAEAQFHICQITTDDTKYYSVISALDQDIARRVSHYIVHPPAEDKYEGIKARLIRAFSLSAPQRAARLLHMGGLGDRRPSALLWEMLDLMDGHETCFLFQQLFLERMPAYIRLLLAGDDFADHIRLAARADALWGAGRPRTPPGPALPGAGEWCYYHQRWGSAARQCRPPCVHPGNPTAARR